MTFTLLYVTILSIPDQCLWVRRRTYGQCLQKKIITMSEKTKQKIEEVTYQDTVITCSCGAVYSVQSTQPAISIEICGACHPFYTGTQKLIDATGRLERYNAHVAAGKQHEDKLKVKNEKRKTAEKESKELEKSKVTSKTEETH